MCKEFLSRIKNGEATDFELILSVIVLIMFGIIIGVIIAPVRFLTLGSFNGNSGSITAPENLKDILKKKGDEEEK